MVSNRPLYFLLPSVLTLLLAAATARGETQMLDSIVAIVGDDVVMQSELEERMNSVTERIQDSDRPMPPEEVLREQVLDRLVTERLQMQMGKRYGIEISEEQLDEAIQNIMRSNQLTEQQLREELAEDGETMEGFRERVRREVWVDQIQQAVVNNRININEQDIDSFLASTDGKYATAPSYRLGHILLPVPSGASDAEIEEVREQAQSIRQQLVDGAGFEQMAMTESKGTNALEGGELGWRRLEQLPELFAETVVEMDEGDVSEPVRSGAGFHILKAHETRSNERGDSMVEQTRARHILIKTSELVDDQAARGRLSELRERVLEGEKSFAELAKEHSEDINSRLQGGDLGWVMPGEMVPQFDRVMNQTEAGEISEPFKSEFGWHILTVEERRDQDMSEQMLRNRAANILRERRFDEELQTWLAEIREQIYVEKKL